MDDRRLAFDNLAKHPWLGRVFSRLKDEDLAAARAFISANSELSKGDFELKINRMFIDRVRPKRYKEIMELLTCANSSITR
jgi:hypothetical protein